VNYTGKAPLAPSTFMRWPGLLALHCSFAGRLAEWQPAGRRGNRREQHRNQAGRALHTVWANQRGFGKSDCQTCGSIGGGVDGELLLTAGSFAPPPGRRAVEVTLLSS